MPTNVTPEYKAADARYRAARTDEDRLAALEEMARTLNKHKGTEKLYADIKTRIKELKLAAYQVGSPGWLAYALALLTLMFGVLPGLFLGAVASGRRLAGSAATLRRSFTTLSYTLVPLGLSGWVAFSLAFVLANGTNLGPVMSDPFGWGWDLFRTASSAWQPVLTWMVTPLQTLALAGGLLWSANLAAKISTKRGLSPLPLIAFMLLVSTSMAWLLL